MLLAGRMSPVAKRASPSSGSRGRWQLSIGVVRTEMTVDEAFAVCGIGEFADGFTLGRRDGLALATGEMRRASAAARS